MAAFPGKQLALALLIFSCSRGLWMRVPMARWAHVVSDAEGPTKAAVQIQQDCRKPRTRCGPLLLLK